MVGPDGLEPSTPRLSSACSNQLSYEPVAGKWLIQSLGENRNGGAGGTRTRDPLLAKQVLYQLSYDPKFGRVIIKNSALKLTLYDQLEPRLF